MSYYEMEGITPPAPESRRWLARLWRVLLPVTISHR